MTLVLTLVAHGCPVAAIEAALGLQGRTVRAWVEAAGRHCEQIHQEQVVQPWDLGQVQADEIRAKVQGGVLWLAMAVAAPTRLWLGGVVSAQRDKHLIRHLTTLIAACARPGLLLISVDGLASYVDAMRRAFRAPQPTSQVGRPPLVPWPGLVLGQVLKQYARRRVIAVTQRLVQGTPADLTALLATTQGGSMLNTAYIERRWRYLPCALGAADPAHSRAGPPPGAAACRPLPGKDTLQLLYLSRQPHHCGGPTPYPGHGRWPH